MVFGDVQRRSEHLRFTRFLRASRAPTADCERSLAPRGVVAERVGERRQMRLDHVANGIDVDAEVLMYEDVAEPADLRPRDLRMGIGDLCREVDDGFADDLQIPFNGILGHVDEVLVAAVERSEIPLTSSDRAEDVVDTLVGAACHSATASASADSDTGRFSSCAGKMSISSRP